MKRFTLITLVLFFTVSCGTDKLTGPGTEFDLDSVVGEMVWVDPGTFLMGDPSGPPPPDVLNPPPRGWRLYFSKRPQHQVTITKGFYLGKYEVTQAQWEAVMGADAEHGSVLEDPDHPAWAMSWYAVQEFIHRLNVAAGDSLYRLPTEAEWEYACRAGTTTTWSFGNDETRIDDYAWYNDDADGTVHKVGMKLPNPWGLYDMHGNVSEWMQDWYSYYFSNSGVDPVVTEPVSQALSGIIDERERVKVMRGGNIQSDPNLLSSAQRNFRPVFGRWGQVGFRLLKRANASLGADDTLILEGTPILNVSATGIIVDGASRETHIQLLNGGANTLTWTISEQENWLSVSSAKGDTQGDGVFSGDGEITVTVNTTGAGLPDGAYEGVVQIQSNGGNLYIPVKMTVGDASTGGGGTAGEIITATLLGSTQMTFVSIPPGRFLMGSVSSEPGSQSDEFPRHQVTISQGFHLGKYEVTQGQWQAVMGTTPWSGREYVELNSNHPAVYISWDDAQAFVMKLNVAVGEDMYRLPTEAEWEYACRSGTATYWSYGNDERQTKYAWYGASAWDIGERYAHQVGTKLPNAWGLYDMHGNVWEWCQDWYSSFYYTDSPDSDPQGPRLGLYRVWRGGAVDVPVEYTRSANRGRTVPSNNHPTVGFRLLKRVQQPFTMDQFRTSPNRK